MRAIEFGCGQTAARKKAESLQPGCHQVEVTNPVQDLSLHS